MQSVVQIKNEINELSYPFKMELFKYTRDLVKTEKKPKISLKEAADKMKDFYQNDKELTTFSSIEGEFYEEE